MNPEYIIINKTDIQKIIEQLEERRKYYLKQNGDYGFHNLNSINAQLELLKQILSQSTSLIPEIEKLIVMSSLSSIDFIPDRVETIKHDYISNLKLDI